MTTAEKYRQLERSPVINTARYIFSRIKASSKLVILGDEIEDIRTGKTPSKQEKRFYEDNYYSWFKPNEIGSEKYLFDASDKLSKYAIESNQATIYEPNTILINAIGDIGRVSILKNKASSNQQITGIRFNKNVLPEYAYYYLVSNRGYFFVDSFKTTLPIVNQKKINTIPFIVPKLTDQLKIVNGLESLEKIKSLDDLHIINSLDWNSDYKTMCRHFFEVQFNIEALSSEQLLQLDFVKKLRQQILQNAVKGKLVPQDPNDEPAIKLLGGIKVVKEHLLKKNNIKKEKQVSQIKRDEIPFEIPNSWSWCRLGQLSKFITSGSRDWAKFYSTEGAFFIRSGDIKTNTLSLDEAISVLLPEKIEGKRSLVEKGDILTTITGGNVGKCAIVENEIPEAYVSQSVALTKLVDIRLGKYIHSCFLSPIGTSEDLKSSIYGIGRPVLSLPNIENLKIPLPPLNEQHRIVSKIEQLMNLCNDLEQSIHKCQKYAQELLQVALKEALEPK